MNRIGLVSVSFSQHSPEVIVEKAKEAGLHFIEWGSDVHVPENDLENAKKVSEITKKAGDKIYLLEFVPDNNIEYLEQEAECLREVL